MWQAMVGPVVQGAAQIYTVEEQKKMHEDMLKSREAQQPEAQGPMRQKALDMVTAARGTSPVAASPVAPPIEMGVAGPPQAAPPPEQQQIPPQMAGEMMGQEVPYSAGPEGSVNAQNAGPLAEGQQPGGLIDYNAAMSQQMGGIDPAAVGMSSAPDENSSKQAAMSAGIGMAATTASGGNPLVGLAASTAAEMLKPDAEPTRLQKEQAKLVKAKTKKQELDNTKQEAQQIAGILDIFKSGATALRGPRYGRK